MTTKSKTFKSPSIEERVAKLELYVDLISQTVYDLIETFQLLPDPPCPPMCGDSSAIYEGKGFRRKRRTAKKR